MKTQTSIPVEKQVLVYEMSNLIADVGGYLGLLLGSSIYSFYKEIAAFTKAKKSIFCGKKSCQQKK